MAKATMVNGIDNIREQAKAGSMAAIIQLLNEQLADQGVRTRAVFAEGSLQLLCEAATPEQLEPASLVPRIQQILEAISPRSVRRVNILARIVREQQLLWFDEISRDPDTQLLWSQEIIIKRPNLIQKLTQKQSPERVTSLTKPQELPKVPVGTRPNRYKRSFWKGLIGGVVVMGVALVGWQAYQLKQQRTSLSQVQPQPPEVTESEPVPPQTLDPFAEAVSVAEQAAQGGTTAETRAEWLALAAQWEQASDLMNQVPSSDPRYVTAQDRVRNYRQNSQSAQAQANNQQ
jgi:hypothetical protein